MPIFQAKKGMVFYAHIPKCGGMSIENSLSALPTHLKNPYLHGDNQLRFPCSPQHFHADIITKMFDVNSFFYSFTVTRHPFSRLLSEYRFRTDIAERQNKIMMEINDWIENTLNQYPNNNYLLDNHIRPQNEFLVPGMDVMKLEEGMDAIISRISRKIGISQLGDSVHRNKSKSLETSIGLESKELIKRFYKSDFETLGYSDNI